MRMNSGGPSGKHPRVCGEDSSCKVAEEADQETPPRMRGRLSEDEVMCELEGNTPAYAGKTKLLHPCRDLGRKHPRVCGEDS